MGKVLKIALKVIGWTLVTVFLLLLASLVAIQSPKVQSFIGHRAIHYLQDSMDAEITFSEVGIRPFESLVLKDVLVRDPAAVLPEADTLLFARHLSAKFSIRGLFYKEGVHVSRILLQDAAFNLAIEPSATEGSGSVTNIQRIFRLQNQPEQEKKDLGNLFDAREVEVQNVRFRLLNPVNARKMAEEGHSFPPGTIDWNHLDVLASVQATDIRYSHDIITGKVEHLQVEEKGTGLFISHAAGKANVGKGRALVSDLILTEKDTQVYLDRLLLDGPLEEYSDFINKIRIEADIRKGSHVSMQTVSYFGPYLDQFTFHGNLQGHVEGTVSDFKLSDIAVQVPDSGVEVRLQGSMTGLPETDKTLLDFQVEGLRFDMPGLSSFVRSWAPDTDLKALEGFAKGQDFTFDGNIRGFLNRMGIQGELAAGEGSLLADVLLLNAADPHHDIGLEGSLQTRSLDMGRILGTESLGEVSLSTRLKTTLAAGGPDLQIDTLHISRLRALDYDYTGISGSGLYKGGAFDGRIVASDPNLSFLFQGVCNLSNHAKDANYQFFASLGYADLNALHLDNRGTSRISFEADANLFQSGKENLSGDFSIRGLTLENDAGLMDIGNIVLNASAGEFLHTMTLRSDFLDGTYSGGKSALVFVNDLKHLVLDSELPSLTSGTAEPWDGTAYDLSLLFRDARDILSFAVPGLYIENNTRLTLSIDRSGTLGGKIQSGRLAFNENYIRDVSLTVDNASSSLQADLTGSVLHVSGIDLNANRLSLYANDDHLGLGYSFDNEEEEATRGELILSADLSRDENGILAISAQALPSNIYYKGEGWGLTSDQILYRDGEVSVKQLLASHEDQALLVDGGFSPRQADTLSVRMEKFDMAFLNTFTGGKPQVQGRATGQALVISPSAPAIGLLAGITCDSTMVAGKPLGKLDISSVWNEQESRFDFNLGNDLSGRQSMGISGFLKPSASELSARAKLDGFDLGYASPVLEGLFSEFGGLLSGTLGVDGTFQKLHLSSENLHLSDGLLTLDFTQVPYQVEGDLDLDDKGLHFTRVSVRDGLDGSGTVRGSLLLDGFSRYGLDTHIRLSRMKVMGLPKGLNSMFYGTLYATGSADITGWAPNLRLDIDATTVKEGELHISASSGGSGHSRQLLTFTEPPVEEIIDPYEQMIASGPKASTGNGNFGIHLNVRPTTDATVYIDISDENSLKASGSGNIEIDSQSATNSFTLNGNYTLNQGSFHFSALNLVSRDFTIQDGSSLRFNGDLWDTDLNVNGLYVTKASLANLIADENAVTRRTVECGINISDKLRNPQVQFSIDIPDLNPTAQAQVDAALNTEDKVQRQFLYLLLAGGFLPSEESGITTNGSEMLFSNVTGIMAGQLNNIFEKLDIPLDLGLNYQSTNAGSNIFDVALSTQLFNNRVIVNGSVGNKPLYGGATTSEVAGDIDIEIKLNNSGSLRANLFSHSADQLTSYLDNSQRNGGGIAYQREFNTFMQFIRSLFQPRQVRAEEERPAPGTPRESSPRPRGNAQVLLQIDSTGHATYQDPLR
ncbi:MAG: hypothetical protein IJ651_06700 [Bacteroidales bacterium]|nr:hypothetical protein [Bacteroidales bacterium]